MFKFRVLMCDLSGLTVVIFWHMIYICMHGVTDSQIQLKPNIFLKSSVYLCRELNITYCPGPKRLWGFFQLVEWISWLRISLEALVDCILFGFQSDGKEARSSLLLYCSCKTYFCRRIHIMTVILICALSA